MSSTVVPGVRVLFGCGSGDQRSPAAANTFNKLSQRNGTQGLLIADYVALVDLSAVDEKASGATIMLCMQANHARSFGRLFRGRNERSESPRWPQVTTVTEYVGRSGDITDRRQVTPELIGDVYNKVKAEYLGS